VEKFDISGIKAPPTVTTIPNISFCRGINAMSLMNSHTSKGARRISLPAKARSMLNNKAAAARVYGV
jgi:hypothetical protein